MSRTISPGRDSRRQVIVHYHLFKNAGSTIDSILESNFDDGFARLDGDRYDSVISNDALIAFLERHGGLAAVTSHHLRPPKPDDSRFVFHDIIFIRHPLTRLLSVHSFYQRAALDGDPLAVEAKSRRVAAFFEWLIDEHPRYASNVQVNLVANAGAWLPRADDLVRAQGIVGAATVAGTVERFNESAVTAEHALSAPFPGIDFSYVPQNVSGREPRSLGAQLDVMRAACGTKLYDRLVALNQLDLALFDHATLEVARRLRAIPNWRLRLERLRLRCSASQRAAAAFVLISNHPAEFVRRANLGVL